jgi:hypothetical protein
MAKTGKKQRKPFQWELPAPHEAVDAFAYFLQRPPRPAKRTLSFIVHKPSGWKIEKLLDAHAYADTTSCAFWSTERKTGGIRVTMARSRTC